MRVSLELSYLLVSTILGATLTSALSSVSNITTLGTSTVIFNNDMDPQTPKFSALLLSTPQSASDASDACGFAGETLYSFSGNVSEQISEIVKGLQSKFPESSRVKRSIASLRKRQKYPTYWISNGSPSNNTICSALAVTGPEEGSIVNTTCTQQLPVLCTNANARQNTIESVPSAAKINIDAPVGSFTGYRAREAFIFQGIRYATAERYQAPVPYTPPQGPYDATSFGASCAQLFAYVGPTGEEDCLFLNIYTPMLPSSKDSKSGGLPVMFWIHGGSFSQGAGSRGYYYGHNLANRGEVVVVTINYRLGLFGWFEATDAGFPRSAIPGNQALRDWLMALQWVQDNIASFGGDPSKVTLFGQSAGASAVHTLLSTSKAKGLFRAAIVQSDPIDIPLNSVNASSGVLGSDYVKMLGCAPGNISCVTSPSVLSVLMDSERLILQSTKEDSQLNEFEIYKPTIDGDLITADFYELVKAGGINNVPLIVGTVRDEADAFVPFLFLTPDMPDSDLNSSLSKMYGANRTQALLSADLYYPDANESDSVRHLLGQIGTDFYWTCPLEYIMDANKSSKKIYRYVMNRGYAIARPNVLFCHNKVCHADDLYVVFGSQHLAGEPIVTEDDLLFSRIVQDRWVSFAHNLDPNPPFPSDVQVPWPAYSASQPNVMQFDLVPQVTQGYREEYCNLLNEVQYDFELFE